jgi:hypothetical protein
MVAEPPPEVLDKLAGGFYVALLNLREERAHLSARTVVQRLVPSSVGTGDRPHQALLVREMLFNSDGQRPRQLLNASSLRAHAHSLLEFLRHPEDVAMFGIDLRKENGVRLRPFEMLHGEIVPDFRV